MVLKSSDNFETFDGNFTKIFFKKDYKTEHFDSKVGDILEMMACSLEDAKALWGRSPFAGFIDYETVTQAEYLAWYKMRESRAIESNKRMLELIKEGKEPKEFWIGFGADQMTYEIGPREELRPSLIHRVETITNYLRENKLAQYREFTCEVCGCNSPWHEMGRIFNEENKEVFVEVCGRCYEISNRLKNKR